MKLKNGEPSERYWLGLFKDWLMGLQSKLDDAQKQGLLDEFDKKNKSTSNELKIAYSMICSYGNTYDCSRVIFNYFITTFQQPSFYSKPEFIATF